MTSVNPISRHSRRHGRAHAAGLQPSMKSALAEHVAVSSRVPGIRGLLINGHAGENFYLTREEATPRRRDRARGGAEGLLVDCRHQRGIEPGGGASGGRRRRRPAPTRCLCSRQTAGPCITTSAWSKRTMTMSMEATVLPIVLYQAPVGAGRMAYPLPAHREPDRDRRASRQSRKAVGRLPRTRQNLAFRRKARRPDIAVLGSGDEHLLDQLHDRQPGRAGEPRCGGS